MSQAEWAPTDSETSSIITLFVMTRAGPSSYPFGHWSGVGDFIQVHTPLSVSKLHQTKSYGYTIFVRACATMGP